MRTTEEMRLYQRKRRARLRNLIKPPEKKGEADEKEVRELRDGLRSGEGDIEVLHS